MDTTSTWYINLLHFPITHCPVMPLYGVTNRPKVYI